MNFWKVFKGEGGHFQSKNLCRRIWAFIWDIFLEKNRNIIFRIWGGGAKGLLEFSQKLSVSVARPILYEEFFSFQGYYHGPPYANHIKSMKKLIMGGCFWEAPKMNYSRTQFTIVFLLHMGQTGSKMTRPDNAWELLSRGVRDSQKGIKSDKFC